MVPLATLLAGADSFKINGNVSDTYRGQVVRDDGSTVTAIIKDLPAKELANELLGATLARLLQLPIPDHYLAIVRGGALLTRHAPANADGDRFVFASADVGEPSVQFRYQHDRPMFSTLIGDLLDWHDLGRLYAADTWSGNVDRHAGNLLFGGGNRVWLIDHGHILTGCAWKAGDLVAPGDFVNKLTGWLTPLLTPAQIGRAITAAAAMEDELRVAPCVDHVMVASRVEAFLGVEDVAGMIHYLRDRIAFISYYSNKALGRATVV